MSDVHQTYANRHPNLTAAQIENLHHIGGLPEYLYRGNPDTKFLPISPVRGDWSHFLLESEDRHLLPPADSDGKRILLYLGGAETASDYAGIWSTSYNNGLGGYVSADSLSTEENHNRSGATSELKDFAREGDNSRLYRIRTSDILDRLPPNAVIMRDSQQRGLSWVIVGELTEAVPSTHIMKTFEETPQGDTVPIYVDTSTGQKVRAIDEIKSLEPSASSQDPHSSTFNKGAPTPQETKLTTLSPVGNGMTSTGGKIIAKTGYVAVGVGTADKLAKGDVTGAAKEIGTYGAVTAGLGWLGKKVPGIGHAWAGFGSIEDARAAVEAGNLGRTAASTSAAIGFTTGAIVAAGLFLGATMSPFLIGAAAVGVIAGTAITTAQTVSDTYDTLHHFGQKVPNAEITRLSQVEPKTELDPKTDLKQDSAREKELPYPAEQLVESDQRKNYGALKTSLLQTQTTVQPNGASVSPSAFDSSQAVGTKPDSVGADMPSARLRPAQMSPVQRTTALSI